MAVTYTWLKRFRSRSILKMERESSPPTPRSELGEIVMRIIPHEESLQLHADAHKVAEQQSEKQH